MKNYRAFERFMYEHAEELESSCNGKLLYVSLVNNDYDTRFSKSSLNHELLHLYQMTKVQGSILGKSRELYSIAVKHIYDEDDLIRLISQAIYISIPSEQNAFCQEVYRTLMEDHETTELTELLKQTAAYDFCEILKNLQQRLEGLIKIPRNVSEVFGIDNIEWYKKLTRGILASLTKRMHRAFIKAKDDISREKFSKWNNKHHLFMHKPLI